MEKRTKKFYLDKLIRISAIITMLPLFLCLHCTHHHILKPDIKCFSVIYCHDYCQKNNNVSICIQIFHIIILNLYFLTFLIEQPLKKKQTSSFKAFLGLQKILVESRGSCHIPLFVSTSPAPQCRVSPIITSCISEVQLL